MTAVIFKASQTWPNTHSQQMSDGSSLSEGLPSMVMEEDTGSLVNGPDQIVTCNNAITWDPKGSVKIRMER